MGKSCRFWILDFGRRNVNQIQHRRVNTKKQPANLKSKIQIVAGFIDYDYAAAGNLLLDAENKRFIYDAENRQTKFFKATNQTQTPDATYEYDGNGKRVRKKSGNEETIFVYNAMGQLIAEYTNQTPQDKISYLTTDHLGSPRIVTDQNGTVLSRHDYLAFGDEVSITVGNVGGRTAEYGADDKIRQQYTGYERDTESGLDYAQARYYNSQHGRFTSADPLTASASIRDPQTFNRYSYVLNSPYKFTDPLGLFPVFAGSACGEWCGSSMYGSGYSSNYSREEENNDSAQDAQPSAGAPGADAEQNAEPPAVATAGGIFDANSITPTVVLDNNYDGILNGEAVIFVLPKEIHNNLQAAANQAEQNQLAYLGNRDQAVNALTSAWHYQDSNSIGVDDVLNPDSYPPSFISNDGQVIPTGVSSGSGVNVNVGPLSISPGTPPYGQGLGEAFAVAANNNLANVNTLRSGVAAENFEKTSEKSHGSQIGRVYVSYVYKNKPGGGFAPLQTGVLQRLHTKAVLKGISTAAQRHYKGNH